MKHSRALALAAMLAAFTAAPAMAEFHQYDLTIEEVTLDVAPGLKVKVWAYNGQVPAPLIRVTEGDELEVKVTNNTTLTHTIHWHGMYQTGTWQSDGVPGVTQKAIEPGEDFTYRFTADRTGTLWYHCHVNVSEHVDLRGMFGPFIVDPKKPSKLERSVTKEAILMFSGWNPEVADTYGIGGKPGEPISYFSINGRSHPTNQPIRVTEGDVLRLRLIAVSTPVAFHLHGHDILVTHKDGLPLKDPYPVDVLPMAPGERYDAIVHMNNPGRWMVHDHIEHHTTNNGKHDGGTMLVVEYEEIPHDDWYMWKDIEYDPDFYYSESMTKGPGLYDVPSHEGVFPDFR